MVAKPRTQPKNKRSTKRWTITSGTGKKFTVDGHLVIRDVNEAVKRLSKDKVIGIDLETTGFSAWKNNIALIQMYGEQSKTLAVLSVQDGVVPPIINTLFKKDKLFIIHNGVGFDMWFMDTHGIPWERTNWHDTLVGETVLASTGRRDISKSLRSSIRRRLGKEIDKDIEHSHWDAVDLTDRQLEYAAQDVLSLPALYRTHLEKAERSQETRALEMEMLLAPLVARMSINGLPCPRANLEKYVRDQKQLIIDDQKYLMKKLGKINLGSHVQLKRALNENGIPVASTGAEVLEPLLMIDGPHSKIIEPLMRWKHGNQRVKMYSQEWMDAHIIDDWVHPHFWQCSADTTRFTSSNPNLQQVPKDSRHIIGNIPGYHIVSVDYSQIEVRIAAKIANDQVLMDALESEDIHREIAAIVYAKPENAVTKRERKIAKAMTFLLLFGGGVQGFYEYVKMAGGDISYEEASNLVATFFMRFQGLKAMKRRAENLAQKPGPVFIRLPNSNRRILIGYNKKSTTILNTMVQGTAAVGLKYGMLEAGKRGLMKYVGAQVHDELVSAIPGSVRLAREYGNELSESMIVGMRKAIDITVKTEISYKYNTWQA